MIYKKKAINSLNKTDDFIKIINSLSKTDDFIQMLVYLIKPMIL